MPGVSAVPGLPRVPRVLVLAAAPVAVTATQRQESLAQASQQAGAAASAYAALKAAHLGTSQACANQRDRFVPMVVEATGAWGVRPPRSCCSYPGLPRHVATRTRP